MRINVSEMRHYLRCPAYHVYSDERNRHPHGFSLAPTLGTAWHRAMRCLFETGDHPRALILLEQDTALVCERTPKTKRAQAHRDSEVLCNAFEAFQLPTDWEVLVVEEQLEMPLGQHTVFGTPDLVIRRKGQVWHVQHKTLSGSASVPAYMRGIQRSWHEAVYNELIAQKLKIRPAGVICIVARKLSLKAAQAAPEALTVMEYMPLTALQVTTALDDFESLATRLQAEQQLRNEVGVRPLQNRDSCFSNNSLCAYVDVCDGRVSLLDDALFRDGQEEVFPRD